eukprot:NODE_1679_length_1252_cov_71.116444_g1664_i0.p3 GENE.NODE_1679_length_1252_cov_71.116444_g1664_i0~~NODE_1679_length_1252_cov_71.116444_g1664_i0.p3  ORF type:complete len:135 (+),score=45.27 NODE_1679_length_1252_cov_71.116444_g1664_i0:773-1177(+)
MQQTINRLTATYLTKSLQDIAEACNAANVTMVEAALLRMIAKGELSARINKRDGMVEFKDDLSAGKAIAALEEEVRNAQRVVNHLRTLDAEVSCTREYMQKSLMRDPSFKEQLEDEQRSKGLKSKLLHMGKGLM